MHCENIDRLWGFIAGILIGAGVGGHALRLQILGLGEWIGRHTVAASAVVLYLVAGILVYFKKKLGLWITIIGPLIGITAVTLSPMAQIDGFQLVLGIPQFLALFLSIYLLWILKDK